MFSINSKRGNKDAVKNQNFTNKFSYNNYADIGMFY